MKGRSIIVFMMMACAGAPVLAVSGETGLCDPVRDPSVNATEGAAASESDKQAKVRVRDKDVADRLDMLQFMDMLEHFDLIRDLDVIQGGGK